MKNPASLFPTSLTPLAVLAVSALVAVSPMCAHGAFTAGNLAVFSADSVTTNNTTFTILELSPSTAGQGSPVNSIAISGTGASAMRTSGSASSTGYLADNNDGTLLTFDAVNSATTSGNVNAIAARGVGTLDNTGAFTLQTTYTAGVSGGTQARGASSINNSLWYIADQDGIYTNGSSRLNSANGRSVKSFGGTVYVLQASASATVVSTLSADGKTLTGLTGLANDSTAQDFYLISSGSNGSTYDVLYVLTTAGIKKYSLVSGTWTSNSSYATVTGFGLCAAKSGGGAVLYVTTGSGATAANNLVKTTDTTGFNAAITVTTGNNVTLYTAATGTTMKGVAFAPIAPGTAVAIDNTGTPATGSIAAGTANVPVFGFRLSPSTGSVDFTGLKLTTAGTATSADLSNFRVVYDADNSGTFNGGDSVVSGSGTALANPINFTITGQTGFSAARRYLVIADVAGGATAGNTFTGSIAAAADVTNSATANGTAAGNPQTIAAGASDMTMATGNGESATISSLINDAAIATTSDGAQAWQVAFSNPSGNAGAATISAITFTQGANNGVANWSTTIQAAELFDGATALAAGTISATSIAFSSLSVAVADNASKTLTLRISLKSTAGALTDHARFQFALTGPNVTVAGNGVTTASVSSDQTQNQIAVVATKLGFSTVPGSVGVSFNFTAVVQAQDANGNVDLDDTTSVTITKATGTGTLTGGGALSLSGGAQTWSSLQLDTVGAFTLQAAGGSLATATSGNINVIVVTTQTANFSPLILPQVMGSGSSTRLPVMFRATVSGLAPATTYRYYMQAATNTDFGQANAGAGNPMLISSDGTTFTYTTSASLNTAGDYETFTTDGSGQYTGWFGLVNTGNARFIGGATLYPCIVIGNTSGTTLFEWAMPTGIQVLAFSTGAGANNGTGIRGASSAAAKNFVALFDNTAGTGRPLAVTYVENEGVSVASAAGYYGTTGTGPVDGIAGAWGTIVPNTLANGVRRIAQYDNSGAIIGANTDADGIWPSAVNTVNPAGGSATALVISSTDAPLLPPSITASAGANGSISPSGATTVIYNGGQSYTITPAGGYHVADVLVDGSSVGAVTTYNFTSVTANHTISATFALNCTTPGILGGISPGSASLYAGNPLLLSLTNVTGTTPRYYQWRTNGVDIVAATNSNYTNLSVALADAGNYVCVVTNACGSITSAVAVVTVNPPPTAGPAHINPPANGIATIQFFGIPNNFYVVQTTTNLTVPWWPITTNTAGNDGSWIFTDPNATNRQQYYRAKQP